MDTSTSASEHTGIWMEKVLVVVGITRMHTSLDELLCKGWNTMTGPFKRVPAIFSLTLFSLLPPFSVSGSESINT